jgi:hypothetical protein
MKVYPAKLVFSFVLSCLVLGISVPKVQAEEDESARDIQQMMKPEEFEAAGLNKLSPAELEKLNRWLQGYRETTVKTAEARAEAKATKEGRRKVDLVVSRIAGPFYGLTGHTIITLEDGTKWKQANPSDRHTGPAQENLGVAVIKAGLFGWRMRIQGTREFYVDQIE